MRKEKVNLKSVLTILLAFVICIGVLPPAHVHAYDGCYHYGQVPTEFRVEDDANLDGGFVMMAKCATCGEWYGYCGEHNIIQADVQNTTCTTDGSYTLECTICHGKKTFLTEKAYGHRFSNWAPAQAATCTAAGQEKRTCEECHLEETKEIPATGHKWSEWSVSKQASCTEPGVEKRTCASCKQEETRQLAATEHKWSDWAVTKAATCLEAGEEKRACSVCKQEEKRELPVTEHKWSEWKVSKPATCKEAGEELRACETCKQEEKRELPVSEHKWSEWTVAKAATCKETGLEKRSCETCKEEETRELPVTEHNWSEWIPTKQAGHGQKGEEERSCAICKDKETREVDGENPLARTGSEGLVVLITQELLAMGGEYAGEADGVMREDLADAIRVFEAANSLPETGDIYPDTLQLLTGRYVESYAPLHTEAKEVKYASGLRMVLELEEQCTSNGDGSHRNTAVVTGVRYSRNEEEKVISLPGDKQQKLSEVTEGCLILCRNG